MVRTDAMVQGLYYKLCKRILQPFWGVVVVVVLTESFGFMDGFSFGCEVEPIFRLDLFYEGIANFGSYLCRHFFTLDLRRRGNETDIISMFST